MGFDIISDFFVQAFSDRNLMLWMVPFGPLAAFSLISLLTMFLWLVRQVTGTEGNTIPASDHHYHDHNHPDYGGMDVPYQPHWFRVTAIVIGMAGIVWALFFAWTLVFGALNEYGAGTFGLVDSAEAHHEEEGDHSEEAVVVEGEDEAHGAEDDHGGEHGAAVDCVPCVYSDEITWMSLGTSDGVYGVVAEESTDYEIGVLIDPLNATLLFMVPLAMLGIFTYSIGYMAHDARQAKFFALISLFAGAMFILTVADNLMMMFVGWEIMGFCSYSLIGFWYEKKSAYNAAIKAFTVTRVADVVMLLGIVYLWSIAGTLNFRDILANPDVIQAIASTPAIILGGWGVSAAGLIGTFLVIGTIGKSAQFPLHVWLPDAMEGPTPVSAMIHAAAMVSAGVYAIIRMYPLFVGLSNPHASDPTFSAPLILMAVVGSFTALFAATMGVAQRDVKAVLAYSTISQLGFMVAALGVGAYIAATFHLITHAFFKALLFMASGSVIHAMEHGEHHVHEHHAAHGHDDHAHDDHGHDDHHEAHFDPQDMFNMGGLSKKIPVTFWTFVAGGLSLAGFPLITAGFWSKDEILAESWYGFASHGSGLHALVFFMLAVAAFLTAFYTMRQIALTFLGEPRTEEADHANLGGQYSIVSITMQAPLILLAFFALFAGFVGVPEDFPIFGAIFSPEHNYFHHLVVYALPFMENGGYEAFHVDAPAFNIIPVLTSFAVALGGLWLGWVMYARNPLEAGEPDPLIKHLGEPIYNALQNRYYIDDLYDWMWVRPSQFLARGVITLLDKGIIDTILHTTGAVFTVIGDFIKVMNAWLIDGVGDGIPKGIYDFGGWIRGTQNGRIQYYLLIVLAAVLIIGVIFAISAGAVFAS